MDEVDDADQTLWHRCGEPNVVADDEIEWRICLSCGQFDLPLAALYNVTDMTPRKDWRPAFIEALRRTGNVTLAARYAGRSRNQAYHVRRRSEDFAAQWDEALEEGTDLLDAEARRRAVTGIDKPVYYKGEVVGSITKYSDRLLMFLLRAHRPQKFRDGGKVEQPGATDVGVDKDTEKAILEKLDRMAALDDEANE